MTLILLSSEIAGPVPVLAINHCLAKVDQTPMACSAGHHLSSKHSACLERLGDKWCPAEQRVGIRRGGGIVFGEVGLETVWLIISRHQYATMQTILQAKSPHGRDTVLETNEPDVPLWCLDKFDRRQLTGGRSGARRR